VRLWWRRLYGDDSNLDDEHLREMAGTFSRRLHAEPVTAGMEVRLVERFQYLEDRLLSRSINHVRGCGQRRPQRLSSSDIATCCDRNGRVLARPHR
jgi:hypothetical protein